ncbi:ketosteroid isomerase-related protein [Protofrankia symbiont of Coriaria ruscifolia]|nr:ketosteroid isomerase-related protein [Protofrankia symbiont of Coriaria ruscifolia]
MSRAAEHAERWTQAITSDTDVAITLYTDDVGYEDHQDADQVPDTAPSKADLREQLAPYANKDADNGMGIHRFEVLEAIETTGGNGSQAVTILWCWTGEHLAGYQGVPTEGKKLTTRGQTWHHFDADGRIDRELTNWNDTPVFQQLGLPVRTPRHWEKDVDPGSLD